MMEIRPACERLHTRLKKLAGEVELMENKSHISSSDSLNKLVTVVTKCLRFLEKNGGKDLIYRVVKFRMMTNELRSLSADVSELLVELLDVAAMDEWEQDRILLEIMLDATINDHGIVLRDLQSPRAQLEALWTLKYEVEKRAAQHEEKDLARMKKLMRMVSASTRGSSNSLPGWYLPEYEVSFEPNPFAKGSFGSVHRGVLGSGTNTVKCICVDDMVIDIRTARQIEKEMSLLRQMDHPNVVKILGASHVSSQTFVVYEDAVNGDLGSFLCSTEDNKQQMWKLLLHAAIGLDYNHKKGIVHGHMKLSNILVGADGQAKLSDFGLNALRRIPKPSSGGSSVGDLRWRAPECLTKRPIVASDVYSFAMCMIEAALGEPPFAYLGDEEVRESLRNGEIHEQPDGMNDDCGNW